MTTISEFNNRNFEKLTTKTMAAREMALSSHNLSKDGNYARMSDKSLWRWSDRLDAWVQIDKE